MSSIIAPQPRATGSNVTMEPAADLSCMVAVRMHVCRFELLFTALLPNFNNK